MSKVAIALSAFFLLASIAVIISIAVVQTHKKTHLSPGLKVTLFIKKITILILYTIPITDMYILCNSIFST